MKLYDLKNGLNPRRVRIFLAEKGISIPSEFVDMIKGENKGERYLAMNPMGTMPVLEFDDGTHLAESIAICRYFEELHPEPPLFGSTTLERAQIEMWNRRMELEIQLPMQDVFVHLNSFWAGRRPQVPEYGRVRQAQVLEWARQGHHVKLVSATNGDIGHHELVRRQGCSHTQPPQARGIVRLVVGHGHYQLWHAGGQGRCGETPSAPLRRVWRIWRAHRTGRLGD